MNPPKSPKGPPLEPGDPGKPNHKHPKPGSEPHYPEPHHPEPPEPGPHPPVPHHSPVHHPAPHHPPHHHPEHHPIADAQLRALNTQENADRAVAAARARVGELKPGRVWFHRAPRGELEIKGALMLDGVPVAGIRFSPDNGGILPKGLHPVGEGNTQVVSDVEARLKEVAPKLTVLEGAEFREPESCWAIPLVYAGRIVSDLKISGDGTRVVPDRKLQEDLKLGR